MTNESSGSDKPVKVARTSYSVLRGRLKKRVKWVYSDRKVEAKAPAPKPASFRPSRGPSDGGRPPRDARPDGPRERFPRPGRDDQRPRDGGHPRDERRPGGFERPRDFDRSAQHRDSRRDERPAEVRKLAVSVVLRTFNSAPRLPELFNRIFEQECPFRVELMVVDGGSTDGGPEALESRGCRMVPVPLGERFVDTAMAEATGDFVVFLTDRMLPRGKNWLNSLVLPLAASPKVALVCGRQVPGQQRSHYEKAAILTNPYLSGLKGMLFDASSKSPGVHEFPVFNTAVRRATWKAFPIGEMSSSQWAVEVVSRGGAKAFVPEAVVELFGEPLLQSILLGAYRRGRSSNDGVLETAKHLGSELWREWRTFHESGLLSEGERGEAYAQALVVRGAELLGVVEKKTLLSKLGSKLFKR
jgi:hypothetical protein